MTNLKLKYIKKYTSKNKDYYYLRKPNQKQILIEGEFGTPEFLNNYYGLLNNSSPQIAAQNRFNKNSLILENLINEFKESTLWKSFYSKNYQAKMQYAFNRLLLPVNSNDKLVNFDLGNLGINHKELTRELGKAILKEFDKANTPSSGNEVMKCFKKLINYAIDEEKWKVDYNPFAKFGNTPTDPDNQKPSNTRLKTGGSTYQWNDQEFANISNECFDGEKTALMLERYLCQRNIDCLNMRWNQVSYDEKDKMYFNFTQKKTNQKIIVPAPIELEQFLKKLDKVSLTIVWDYERNKPIKQRYFYKKLNTAIERAGYDTTKYNAHGLRYRGITELAEAGCTDHEIMAISGHKSLIMVQKYTALAHRGINATSGMAKVEKFKRKNKV